MPDYILKWNEQKKTYDKAIELWKKTGCTWAEAWAEVTGQDIWDVQDDMSEYDANKRYNVDAK